MLSWSVAPGLVIMKRRWATHGRRLPALLHFGGQRRFQYRLSSSEAAGPLGMRPSIVTLLPPRSTGLNHAQIRLLSPDARARSSGFSRPGRFTGNRLKGLSLYSDHAAQTGWRRRSSAVTRAQITVEDDGLHGFARLLRQALNAVLRLGPGGRPAISSRAFRQRGTDVRRHLRGMGRASVCRPAGSPPRSPRRSLYPAC